jgi:hypothetical protein
VLNATFNNISVISWRPVLVVEEAEVPGENFVRWLNNFRHNKDLDKTKQDVGRTLSTL